MVVAFRVAFALLGAQRGGNPAGRQKSTAKVGVIGGMAGQHPRRGCRHIGTVE
jgi:hypothetical protein